MHGCDYGCSGTIRFLPAAQNTDVSAFECQNRCVGGDIRAAFIDNGHDTHRDGSLADHKPVGPCYLCQNFSDRVGKLRNLPHAICHGGDAASCQTQTVEHDIGNDALRCTQIFCICGENHICICFNRIGHPQNGLIFFFASQPCKLRAGSLGMP